MVMETLVYRAGSLLIRTLPPWIYTRRFVVESPRLTSRAADRYF